MISYQVIIEAKMGNKEAVAQILEFYLPKIKKISKEDEFVQMALIAVYNGIKNFRNIEK
ncbi:MAG: hypothetical protein E7314_05665 [Clostridiales bacterium]|nr:hypothetical protein [Clostridiales bacterium]